MNVRRLVAGVAVLAALAAPASADPDHKEGYNNGDEGLIAFVYDTIDAAAHGSVGAQCEFHQQPRPNSSQTVVVLEGHAHVVPRGTVRAVSTYVRCRLRNVSNPNNVVVVLDDTQGFESFNGVWVPQQTTSIAGMLEVCGAIEVHWGDATTTGGIEDGDLVCEQPT